MAQGIRPPKIVNLPEGGNTNSQKKNSGRPIYEAFDPNGFTLRITETQLRKSTINANKTVQKALLPIIDYSTVVPGEKVVLPCKLRIDGKVTQTKASFLIPKRRGTTNPEPRLWPYHLNSYVSPNTLLWFHIKYGELEICDHDPR